MSKSIRHHEHRIDTYGRRQPRPDRRRTGTRHGIIRAAILEG